MAQNDFLYPLLALHPLLVALIVFISNFISLLIPAFVKKTVTTHLFKNPAFLIGDFFLLPVTSGLIALFYQHILNPVAETMSVGWTTVTFVLSVVLSFVHALRYNVVGVRYIAWLPHGVFFVLFGYLIITFISKGFWQLTKGDGSTVLWVVWALVVLAILVHELLGKIWPKSF